ncbi:unnamed protein product, partial [Closterium sp. Yama58-4]
MLCASPCDLSSKTASTVVSAMEGAAGMEHAMSLYRPFHELEAPCPSCPPFMAHPPSPSRPLPPPLNPAPAILPLAALTCPSVPRLHPCSLSLPRPFPLSLPIRLPKPPPSLHSPPDPQTPPQTWADAYGLSADSLLPPSPLSLPPSLPPAPHLEDCAALTALRQQAEQRGEGGEPPAWADPPRSSEGGCCHPRGTWHAESSPGETSSSSSSSSCNCPPQPPWVS